MAVHAGWLRSRSTADGADLSWSARARPPLRVRPVPIRADWPPIETADVHSRTATVEPATTAHGNRIQDNGRLDTDRGERAERCEVFPRLSRSAVILKNRRSASRRAGRPIGLFRLRHFPTGSGNARQVRAGNCGTSRSLNGSWPLQPRMAPPGMSSVPLLRANGSARDRKPEVIARSLWESFPGRCLCMGFQSTGRECHATRRSFRSSGRGDYAHRSA